MNPITQVAQDIKEQIAPVLQAMEARNFSTFEDPETPGLQFDAKIMDRDARVLITLEYGGTFKVYIFNPNTMETVYSRTGIDEDKLASVFAEDLEVSEVSAR